VWSPIGYDSQLMNSRYGFEMSNGSSESLNGQPYDPAGTPFNGPFGPVGEVLEGGGMQGYYSRLPEAHRVFGTDKAGRPTLVMDCNSMDFLVADTDVFTDLNMAYYSTQYPLQLVEPDRLFGNMLDFITHLPPPPLIRNDGTQLTLSSAYQSYQWYKDSQMISGETGAQLNAKGDGKFYVEVPVRGGCKVRSNAIEFKNGSAIDNSKFCEVFVPGAFSPDGNGLNEKAHVYGGCIQDVKFRIFDRWGELVFESANINDGWDGMFNGRRLPAGVFAWSLAGKFPDGSDLKKSGHITLVR
jgi:gliding motility-associated-like protein